MLVGSQYFSCSLGRNVVGYKFGMLFINVKQMFQHVDTVMWIFVEKGLQ